MDRNKITLIDHAAYQKKVKTMTADALRFTIKDCQEALAANPDYPHGHKCGYYQDEIHYCAMELRRRVVRETITHGYARGMRMNGLEF